MKNKTKNKQRQINYTKTNLHMNKQTNEQTNKYVLHLQMQI
jgi:hypothetical protein